MCAKCNWHKALVLMNKLDKSGKAPWGETLIREIARKVFGQQHITPKQLEAARSIEQRAGIKTIGDYDVQSDSESRGRTRSGLFR